MSNQAIDEKIEWWIEYGCEMRDIQECVHEIRRAEQLSVSFWTINHQVHVAELINVIDDTTGMTDEEKEYNSKQYQTQIDFFPLTSGWTEPKKRYVYLVTN